MSLPDYFEIKNLSQQEFKQQWQQWTGNEFTGYIMMSDRSLEFIWTQACALPTWEDIHREHNFIWEANLYQPGKTSIAIRQINDGWQVTIIDWTQVDKQDIEWIHHDYLVPSQSGYQTMTIAEAWLAQQDDLCADMQTLKPAWTAFIGFKDQGDNQ